MTHDSRIRTMKQAPANAHCLLALLLLTTGLQMAAQQFVVVSTESKVPVRDVLVYTDDRQETTTAWDGTFTIGAGFRQLTLQHPAYEKRIMDAAEAATDTIWLIPSINALREVVVYGQMPNTSGKAGLAMSKTDLELLQAHPGGFNPLGLLFLAADELYLKKVRHHKAMERQKRQMILDNY